MEGKEDGNGHTSHIFINKKKFETSENQLTGAQILALAGLSTDEYDIFLVKGDGKSDRIGPDAFVQIKNGLHFNAITKGVNFG